MGDGFGHFAPAGGLMGGVLKIKNFFDCAIGVGESIDDGVVFPVEGGKFEFPDVLCVPVFLVRKL